MNHNHDQAVVESIAQRLQPSGIVMVRGRAMFLSDCQSRAGFDSLKLCPSFALNGRPR